MKCNSVKKNKVWIIVCLALSFIVMYCVYSYYTVHRIGDSDYYWHIMLGRYALNGGVSLDSLVWSNEIYGNSYTNYSVITDIILYKLSCLHNDETFGALVYVLASSYLLAAIVFIGWGRKVISQVGISIKSTLTSIFAIVSCIWLLYMAKGNPRPHLMALICFVVAVRLLENRSSKAIYGCALLGFVWANIHGASMPLLVVMEIAYIMAAVPYIKYLNVETREYTHKEYIQRIIAVLLTVLASLFNSAHAKIYTQLLYVSNNTQIMPVTEWKAATITSSVGVVLLLAFLVFAILSKRKIFVCDVIPVAISGVLMMLHVRFETWFFAAFSIFVLKQAGSQENNCNDKSNYIKTVLYAVTVVSAFCCVWNISTKEIHSLRPLRYPSDEVIEIINKCAPQHMYNDMNTGAFFEYNGIPVIMDSRVDMYNEEFLMDMNTIKGKVSVTNATLDYTDTILNKYDIDMVTLCKGDSMMLIGYMTHRSDWHIVYQDNAYVIFQKSIL